MSDTYQDIKHIGLEASIAFVRAMSLKQLPSDEVVAVITDLQDPLLNVVIHTETIESNLNVRIDQVFQFYQQHNVPWFWIVGPLSTPNTLSQHLIKRGMELIEQFPSMYFDLQNDLFITTHPDFVIREAESNDELYEWVKPLREAFPSSDGAEGYRQLNAKLAHGPSAAFRHYIGYFQNEPVCSGTLFVSENAVMIHNIGTKPMHRYRGYGTAITLRAMQDAKKLGIRHCFLDASESGMTVYQRIGFRIYANSQLFSAPK